MMSDGAVFLPTGNIFLRRNNPVILRIHAESKIQFLQQIFYFPQTPPTEIPKFHNLITLVLNQVCKGDDISRPQAIIHTNRQPKISHSLQKKVLNVPFCRIQPYFTVSQFPKLLLIAYSQLGQIHKNSPWTLVTSVVRGNERFCFMVKQQCNIGYLNNFS